MNLNSLNVLSLVKLSNGFQSSGFTQVGHKESVVPTVILILMALSPVAYIVPQSAEQGFWSIQIVQWVQLLFLIFLSLKSSRTPPVPAIATAYLLSRALLFLSPPLLEDDFYRYLWDGNVLSNGMNPYMHPPASGYWENLPSPWREKINFPDIGTIYPPIAQYYFALIFLLFGESLLGLRLGSIVLELIGAVLLCKLIKLEKISLKPLVVFLFFPTLMKENVNSVHFDMLASNLLFFAFIMIKYKSQSTTASLSAWGAFALATCTKLFPLVFLPLMLKHTKRPIVGALFFLLVVLILYLPFLDAGIGLLNGTIAFTKHWRFFESIPYYVQIGVALIEEVFRGSQLYTGEIATRIIIFVLMLATSIFISLKKSIVLENKVLSIFLFLYLFSMVLNSWYWLWSLPFLILYGFRIFWVFPVITTLGYSWFVSEDLYQKLHYPMYGIFLLILVTFFLQSRVHGLAKWR